MCNVFFMDGTMNICMFLCMEIIHVVIAKRIAYKCMYLSYVAVLIFDTRLCNKEKG